MLDLKNQLLKAGLVTEDQVEKVEKEEADKRAKKKAAREKAKARQQGGKGGKGKGPRGKGKGKGPRGKGGKSDAELWKQRIAKLQAAGKAEQYDAIRNWVKRHRLDPEGGLPSEQAERFHFEKDDGGISWLTIEPDLKAKVTKGEAGIIAFMSNHGMTHCVVPRKIAEDVGKLRPEWVRSLKGWVAIARKEPEQKANEAPKSEAPANSAPATDVSNSSDADEAESFVAGPEGSTSAVVDGELGLADGEGQDASVGDDELVVAEQAKDGVVSGDLKD